MTADDRARSYFLQGVLVTDRMAYLFARTPEFRQLRLALRGTNREVDDLLVNITERAQHWQETSNGSGPRKTTEVTVDWYSPRQLARQCGVTEHGVRLAIREGRLPASKTDGRWRINHADALIYKTSRPK